MLETTEILFNKEIESYGPKWTPLAQVHCGALWERTYSDEFNNIFVDYVVYAGVKNSPPSYDRFGFKIGNRSIYRRAFRFSTLDGALSFGNIHSIILEEE